jgi:GntR family transcriptional regulator
VARRLQVQRGDVLLRLEGRLFARDGRALDHSWSYFLPGSIRLHIVRRVGKQNRVVEEVGSRSTDR